MQINKSSNCHTIKTEWLRCHPQLTKFAEINTSHQSIFRQFLLIQLWMPRCQSTFSYLTKSEPHIISFLVRKCETQNQSSRVYIVQTACLNIICSCRELVRILFHSLFFLLLSVHSLVSLSQHAGQQNVHFVQKSCSTKMTNIHSIFNTKDFCKIT